MRTMSEREWTLTDVAMGWVTGFEDVRLSARVRLIRRANGKVAKRMRESEVCGARDGGSED